MLERPRKQMYPALRSLRYADRADVGEVPRSAERMRLNARTGGLAFAILIFFNRYQMANRNRTMAMSESTAHVVSSFQKDNKRNRLSCAEASARSLWYL